MKSDPELDRALIAAWREIYDSVKREEQSFGERIRHLYEAHPLTRRRCLVNVPACCRPAAPEKGPAGR